MKRISETYLFLRGGKWYFGLRVDGKQIKLSTKTADRSEAERIAAAYRLQLMGEMSLKHGKITECASVYRERFLRDRPINALRQHDAMLKRLLEFLGRDVPLSSITSYKAEDWRDWLTKQTTSCARWTNQKPLSRKYINEHLTWLGSMCKYHGLTSPVAGIKKVKKSKEESRNETIIFWDKATMAALLKAVEGTTFEIPYRLLLGLGCRPAELLSLRNDATSFDVEQKVIRLLDKRGRTRGLQLAGPFSEMWKLLRQWIDEQQVEPGAYLFPQYENWLMFHWRRLLNKVGLPHCMTHQLRHQFVQEQFLAGQSLEWISKWCGHRTSMAYERYSRLMVMPSGPSPSPSPSSAPSNGVIIRPVSPVQRVLQRARDTEFDQFMSLADRAMEDRVNELKAERERITRELAALEKR